MQAQFLLYKISLWIFGGRIIRFKNIFNTEKIQLKDVDTLNSYQLKNGTFFLTVNDESKKQYFFVINRSKFEHFFEYTDNFNGLPSIENIALLKILIKRCVAYIPRTITLHYILALFLFTFLYTCFGKNISSQYSNEIANFPLISKNQDKYLAIVNVIIQLLGVLLIGVFAPFFSYFIQVKYFPPKYSNFYNALRVEVILNVFVTLILISGVYENLKSASQEAQQAIYDIPACRVFGIKSSCATMEQYVSSIQTIRALASKSEAKTK